jgi:hypothetical protein
MVAVLKDKGLFTASEWAAALGREIADGAQESGNQALFRELAEGIGTTAHREAGRSRSALKTRLQSSGNPKAGIPCSLP